MGSGNTLYINNCLFNGVLAAYKPTTTTNKVELIGGLIAYLKSGTISLTRVVFDGDIRRITAMEDDGTATSTAIATITAIGNYFGKVLGGANKDTDRKFNGNSIYINSSYSSLPIYGAYDVTTLSTIGTCNYTDKAHSEINQVLFSYELNNANSTCSSRCWTIQNNTLAINVKNYTNKVTFSASSGISSVSSADYTSPYIKHDSTFTITVKSKVSEGYLATGISALENVTQISELEFTGKTTSCTWAPTITAEYKKVPTMTSLTGTFDPLEKTMYLSWKAETSSAPEGSISLWRKDNITNEYEFVADINSISTETYEDSDVSFNNNYTYILRFTGKFQDKNYVTNGIHYSTYQQSNEFSSTTEANANIVITAVSDQTSGGIKIDFEIPNHKNLSGATYALSREGVEDIVGNITYNSTLGAVIRKSYSDSRNMADPCANISYKLAITPASTIEGNPNPIAGATFYSNESTALPWQNEYGFKDDYKSTKGEYSGQVKLTWNPINPTNSTLMYKIYRKKAETEEEYSLLNSITSSDETFVYNDDQVLPGIVYEYKIELYTQCSGNYIYYTEITDIGFSQLRGTVAGQITYGSGTAVEGVNVFARNNSISDDDSQFKSLAFTNITENKWYMGKSVEENLFKNNDFSIQMYLRPNASNTGTNSIINIYEHTKLNLIESNGNYLLQLAYYEGATEKTLTTDFTIPANKYRHISIIRQSNTYSIYVVNDDDLNNVHIQSATATLTSSSLGNIPNATEDILDVKTNNAKAGYYFHLGAGFKGYLDEIRIWSKALDTTNIKTNYNRLLAGNESNLKAYWQFDEGLTTRFFDVSKSNGLYNCNHGYLTKTNTMVSNIVPDEETQLGLKGITDANGNYMITGIPYSGEGASYSIVPLMGVHSFQPSEHLRYISQSSLIHNSTDFTDISSFEVSGKVTYANSTFPVEGVSLKIDGSYAIIDNNVVKTDAEGKYTIDVPIGEHYISVEMTKHIFENDGRYPIDPNGLSLKSNFLNPRSGIDFVDNTTVRIAGRVVGGNIESDKTLGLGLSTANIGSATIELETQGICYFTEEQSLTSHDTNINSNASIQAGAENGRKVTIHTDAETGEYLLELPPLQYNVVNIKTNSVTSDMFGDVSEIISPDVNTTTTDSIANPEDTTEYLYFTYHSRFDKKYKVQPKFEVVDNAYETGAFGDSVYYVSNGNLTDTVRLFSYDGSNINYLLQHPVFSLNTPYEFSLKAYEEYTNADAENVVVSSVPCEAAVVTITNQIGNTKLNFDTDELSEESNITITAGATEITLDENGEATYNFSGGLPNIIAPHTLSLNMSLDADGSIVDWALNGNSEGVILGGIPKSGNDFITTGPDLIDFILHDPVGSGSYAYLSEGSVINSKYSFGGRAYGEGSIMVNALLGVDVKVSTGIGVEIVTDNQFINTIGVGLSSTSELIDNTTWSSAVTLTQTIQTSSSSDYVGDEGDIYIGKSTNFIIGEMLNLGIYPSNNISDGTAINSSYSIGTKECISMNTSFGTNFFYTQKHIINSLIPNLKSTRKNLLQYVNSYADTANYTVGESSLYFTTIPLSDDIWESNYPIENGEEYVWIAAATGSSSDQVATLTSSILSWENAIANNEKVKIDNFGDTTAIEVRDGMSHIYNHATTAGSGYYPAGFVGNTSFDAGTNIERSLERSTSKEDELTTENNFYVKLKTEFGASINGVGLITNAETSVGGGVTHAEGASEEKTVTYGYVLSDEDSENYLSVDIYLPLNEEKTKPIGGHSYIFRNRGGQSSCPYEGPTATQYYNPGTELNPGAQQLDQPQLLVTSQSILNEISSGQEASYTISIANANLDYDRSYVLSYDESTNTDGLSITMDGSPLSIERSFSVPAGGSISKLIKVKQTNTGILDYENIRLVLASSCGDIESEQFISIHYVPSSTNLVLSSNDLILNTSTSSTSSDTCRLTISDFDRNFYGLAAIRYQYKAVGDINWTTIKEYVVNEELIPLTQNNELLPALANVTYKFPMSNASYPDGTYTFRAISVGKPGGANDEEVIVSSNEIQVIKDKSRPQLFGNAQPSNGILTPDNEISVLFNEDIRNNYIIDDFFSVKGIMNYSEIDDKTGLQFTGGEPAATQANISLANRSFSIETWFKRTPGQAGTIIAHGSDFSLGFNSDDKVILTINGQSYISEQADQDINWQYISVSFNDETQKINVYSLYGTYTGAIIANIDIPAEYTTNNKLYIGAKADGSEGFTGTVNETTLWGYARSLYDLSDKDATKAGNETGLIGYWQMNEGYGLVANDKSRSRHLYFPNENYWLIDAQNIAVNFNGTNEYIDIESKVIDYDESYALEFWFNGGTQANATLFSCGNGILDSVTENKLSLYFNENQKLSLNSNGNSLIISDVNYLDNVWHHLALNVLRTGVASVYIDGTLVKQISVNNIGGLLNSTFTLGACKYRTPENMLATTLDDAYTINNYFAGSIDEVRIWKSSITADVLSQSMRCRISGDEQGLVAYYPFEKYINTEIYGTLSDKINQAEYTGITPANDATGTFTYTEIAPALKEARPLENVGFSWTSSNNKIVISLTESAAKIEGSIIELSINNVSDLNGNFQDEAIKWTAYVDMNRLKWSDTEMNIEIEEDESYSFQVLVSNQSGREENWVISNIPSWLEVSQTQGTLQPLATQTITFEIADGVSIGNYEEILSLTGYYQIKEPFAINLKVTGTNPGWTVDPSQFESNMSLIGQTFIENVPQTNSDDIVAAFIGETCVGVINPSYLSSRDAYYVFMTIYGNEEDYNENVSFKLWDASTGRIYTVVEPSEAINFTPSSVYGSAEQPVQLNALDVVAQQISLNQGWNWISTNIEMINNDGYSQLKQSLSTSGLLIKSPADGSLSTYSTNNFDWFGSLENINNETMYMVKTSEAHNLSFNGEIANPDNHTISLNGGWNYIGFVSQNNLTVNTALADIEAADGDIIKSQTQFATYISGNGWIGNLTYMQPGSGYMYKSLNDGTTTFTYPTTTSYKGNNIVVKDALETHWTANTTEYPTNMTLTFIVKVDTIEQSSENIEIGAFVNNECRGTVRLVYESELNRYIGYLMIYGEANNNVKLRFYDHSTNAEREFVVYPQFTFIADAAYGTPDEPYSANFSTTPLGIESNGLNNLNVYPNPTNNFITISNDNNIMSLIEICDIAGRTIYSANPYSDKAVIDLTSAVDGMYFIRVTDTMGNQSTIKVTKQ